MLNVDWVRGLTDKVSGDRLMEVTARIASAVRLSGAAEELKAAESVRDLLDAAGLRTQLVFHDAYISLPRDAHVVTGDGERLPCITHSFSAATGPAGVESECWDLGDAMSAVPGDALGGFALMDGLATPGKVAALEAGGAAGQVYVNGDLTHEMIVSTVWGSPGQAERDRYPRTPVVSVTHRGLRLAFWSGHSHGRYSGSAWYADNQRRELRDRCVAHVNVDSVGGRGASVLSEGIAMASTRALGADAIRAVTGLEFEGSRVGRAGDQSFVGLGIPSLWMSLSEQPLTGDPMAAAFANLIGSPRSGGLGWWWHTTEDTMDKLDPDVLLRDARIYVHALGRLLAEPLLPLGVAAEAAEVLHAVQDLALAAEARFDLAPVLRAAADAAEAAAALERWRDQAGGAEVAADTASAFNRGVSGLLRGLVGRLYSRSGPFAHDATQSVPPLPLLDPVRRLASLPPESDEARLLAVELVRARNRVEDSLVRGTTAARAALERLQ